MFFELNYIKNLSRKLFISEINVFHSKSYKNYIIPQIVE
jgi:hypothetical protein